MKNYFILVIITFLFSKGSLFSQEIDKDFWVVDGTIKSILTNESSIFVGGNFNYIGKPTGCGAIINSYSGEYYKEFPIVNGIIKCGIKDGKGGFYLGGDFTRVGDFDRVRLCHLKSDWSVDENFNIPVDDIVNTIALNSNGELFIGGKFLNIGNEKIAYLAKIILSTGKVDPKFSTPIDRPVKTITIDKNDVIYCGAEYNYAKDLSLVLTKLDRSGKIDNNFKAKPDRDIYSLLIDDNNNLFVGGVFFNIGGEPVSKLAKLNSKTGLCIKTFNPKPNYEVNCLTLDNFGNLIAGGGFNEINNFKLTYKYLVKMDTIYGKIDTSFKHPITNNVYSILYDKQNSIYASGNFIVNGTSLKIFTKINVNTGKYDPSFKPYVNNFCNLILPDTLDRILIGGNFSSVNTIPRECFVKIDKKTNSLDLNFPNSFSNASGGVESMTIDKKGFLYICGLFSDYTSGFALVKYNSITNEVDKNFKPNTQNPVYRVIDYNDSTIIVGGVFNIIGGKNINNIARLYKSTGKADTSFLPNLRVAATTMILDKNGNIFAANGNINVINGINYRMLAKYSAKDGKCDTAFNPNPTGFVSSVFADDNGKLWISGNFDSLYNKPSSGFAKIDINSGKLDTSGLQLSTNNKPIYSFYSGINNDLYIGGSFDTIAGKSIKGLCKINTQTNIFNDSINFDITGRIQAITIDKNYLYIGGSFSKINNIPLTGIARIKLFDVSSVYPEIIENSPIEIYPNPAIDQFSIKLPENNFINVEFTIYDLFGNKIETELNNTNKLNNYLICNTSRFANGYYYIITKIDSKLYLNKILIMK